jgi:peptidoglycan hydrolase CwlO-like protein
MATAPILKLWRIKKNQLVTGFFVITFILIVGMCVTMFFMFRYMQTINSNVTSTEQNVQQTDNDVQQSDSDVQQTDTDVQNTDSDVQNICNAISGC